MKHFFYYRFSPSPSVRTVLRYISAMDMKPLFHSVMRNKRKSPVRYYSCSDDVSRILPIQPDVSCFAHEKESDCLFPLLCIQGSQGPGKNMGNGCPYFPSLPGQALCADNPAVLFLNLLLCNKDTIAPFSERAL